VWILHIAKRTDDEWRGDHSNDRCREQRYAFSGKRRPCTRLRVEAHRDDTQQNAGPQIQRIMTKFPMKNSVLLMRIVMNKSRGA
jgi:hypothetical protein